MEVESEPPYLDQSMAIVATIPVPASQSLSNQELDQLIECYSKLDKMDYKSQSELLEKISKLDPKSAKWQFTLYKVKRNERRNSVDDDNFLPNKDEIRAIAKASELDPGDTQIIIACCFAMVDFLKYNGINWRGYVCFGKGRFLQSGDEILAAIRTEAKRAIQIDPSSVSVNISLADIFATGLPFKLRDTNFARECLERALQFNPRSSTVNSRLGTFYCQVMPDLEKAEIYFLSAMGTDDHDGKAKFSAIVDILQSVYLMSSPEKFEDLINRELSNLVWDNKQKSKLYYIRGLYYFSKEDVVNGVNSWLVAANLDQSVLEIVKFIDRDRFRYQWPENLNHEDIFLILGKALREPQVDPQSRKLLVQFRQSLDAQYKKKEPSQHSRPHMYKFRSCEK